MRRAIDSTRAKAAAVENGVTKIDTTKGPANAADKKEPPKESLGKTTEIKSSGKAAEAAPKPEDAKLSTGTGAAGSLSKTMAPQASEKFPKATELVRNKNAQRIHDIKKIKIANEVYAEILEETLMQTRKLLNDANTGIRVLKDEYNWQVRNNQRLEKVLKKVQLLGNFQALLHKADTEKDLIGHCIILCRYIEKKINKTIYW